MTSRSKSAVRSYEAEIEKVREESNWKKCIELAQQLKSRSPQHESLAHFLIGEGKLETYLNEWPPIKENIERAQRELSEARGYLTLATDEAGKKAGVSLDSYLLLGKLNYACGAYEDALKNYKLADLSHLTEKELPVRSLRVIAESFAIKGLCLELTAVPGSTSRFKQAERESEMVRSFELSSDLTLLYLQRSMSKESPGPILEAGLLKVPALHLRAGRVQAAVDRYREMLSAEEAPATQSFRLTVARQLAELLLRGLNQEWKPPPKAPAPPSGSLPRRRENVSEGPWKPRKYSSINQFSPMSSAEETVLALLVGEAAAVRDAVLSQSPEFGSQRAHNNSAAACIIDLLALAAQRWGQLCLLLESLERAMKFSFGDRHVWRQRALATAIAANQHNQHNQHANTNHADNQHNQHAEMSGAGAGSASTGAGVRAYAVMRSARALCPGDAALRLVGANTCYDINYIEEGIELAKEALEIELKKDKEGYMLARCYLIVGVGYQMKAEKTNSLPEKVSLGEKSLQLLSRSVGLDPDDHLAHYHVALHHSRADHHDKALLALRDCLRCQPANELGLKLLTEVCMGRGAEAAERGLQVATMAREQYPHAVWPLAAITRLAAPPLAVATGRELLELVRGRGEGDHTEPAYCDLDADTTHTTRDAASIRAESSGAYRLERALSDQASSGSRPTTSPRATAIANAWLLLAELCLRINRVPAAWACVSEAAALQPYSHLVLYTRGLVHAARGEWQEARHWFQNALAVHPTHPDTIINLGLAYYRLGWARLAERVLRAATGHAGCQGGARGARARALLAHVLAAHNQHAAAAGSAARALHRLG